MAFNHVVVNDYSNIDTANSNVGVFVRFRPLAYVTKIEEKTLIASFIHMEEGNTKKLEIRNPNPEGPGSQGHYEVVFAFDDVFDTDATQEEIFEAYAKPQIDHVIEGYNACCFAYGQTGSGKTFSMFGDPVTQTFDGVIPRTVSYLFDKLAHTPNEVAVGCSFLEIYNERIRDLAKNYDLSKANPSQRFMQTSALYEEVKRKVKDAMMDRQSEQFKEFQQQYEAMNCEIQQDENGRVFVKNLTTLSVTSAAEVIDMLTFGLNLRATHETKMNATSSRSHTIFTFYVAQKLFGTNDTIFGQLHLVDLAGSERQKSTESVGSRFAEANSINTSLSALGKVIVALDPASGVNHIPYRESKLTRVLQNSLSKNSFVSVLAHIHPRPQWYEESLSSLEFANRLRKVHNNPHVNHFSSIDMAHKWTYAPKCFGKVMTEIDDAMFPPDVRLMYSQEPKLIWKLNAYATFEVYEHVHADIIEVMAFDTDSDVEFNHIYLIKSEMHSIYKREVTIAEKRKAWQTARIELQREQRGEKKVVPHRHRVNHTSTKTAAGEEEDELLLSEEALLARDTAIRDTWIGEYIIARINPMSKTESTAAYIEVLPLEHDIRQADGTLPYLATKPDNVLPIARTAPGPREIARLIGGKFDDVHHDHSMVQNHLERADKYQAAAFHHSQSFIHFDAKLALDMSRLNMVPDGDEGKSCDKGGTPRDSPDKTSSRHSSGGSGLSARSEHLPSVDMLNLHGRPQSHHAPARELSHGHGHGHSNTATATATATATIGTGHLPSVVHTPQSGYAVHPHILHSPSGDMAELPAPPASCRSEIESGSTSMEEHLPSVAGNGRISEDFYRRLQSKHSKSFNDLDRTADNGAGAGGEGGAVNDEEDDSSGSKKHHHHHHHHHHKKHHHHHHHSQSENLQSSGNEEDGPNTIP